MHILNAEEMRRAVTRLAMQATEVCKGTDFVLVGIRTRGSFLPAECRRRSPVSKG